MPTPRSAATAPAPPPRDAVAARRPVRPVAVSRVIERRNLLAFTP
jgi:hypothetical protein